MVSIRYLEFQNHMTNLGYWKVKIITAMPERKTEAKTIFFKYFPNCHFNNGLTTEYANLLPLIPVNANAKQIVINVSV